MSTSHTNIKNNDKAALERLKMTCARRELCIRDAQRKLKEWAVDTKQQEKIIATLLKEKYIDEARYAKAFVKDKHALDGWGRIKIQYQLRAKGLKAQDIQMALATIEEDKYLAMLQKLLKNKLKTLDKTDPETALIKLYRYAASKGYEQGLIEHLIGELL
jgi:regulatory protein